MSVKVFENEKVGHWIEGTEKALCGIEYPNAKIPHNEYFNFTNDLNVHYFLKASSDLACRKCQVALRKTMMNRLHEHSKRIMDEAKRIDEALAVYDGGNERDSFQVYYRKQEGWTDESLFVDEVLLRLFIAFEDDLEGEYTQFVASPDAAAARAFYDTHEGTYLELQRTRA